MNEQFFGLMSGRRFIPMEKWAGEPFEGINISYDSQTMKTQEESILRGMADLLYLFGEKLVIRFITDLVDEYECPLCKAVSILTSKKYFIFTESDMDGFIKDVFFERYSLMPRNDEMFEWVDLTGFEFRLENAIREENNEDWMFLPDSECMLIRVEKDETYNDLVTRIAHMELSRRDNKIS